MPGDVFSVRRLSSLSRRRGFRCSSVMKLVLSCGYFFASIVLTSVTMVFVHDRVPDQDKYPPLPGTGPIAGGLASL